DASRDGPRQILRRRDDGERRPSRPVGGQSRDSGFLSNAAPEVTGASETQAGQTMDWTARNASDARGRSMLVRRERVMHPGDVLREILPLLVGEREPHD